MATGLLSTTWAPENFLDTTLSSDITAGDTDIFLSQVPTNSEGTLVIDPDSTSNREIIYYNSKTATKVVAPANGRGYDNTTALPHNSGTRVIMAPVADWFNSLKTLFTTTPQGWTNVAAVPLATTYLGNRSYQHTYAASILATKSLGMRNRYTRTVTAPTQCTDLESSSSQYFSRASASVAAMTFTDDFVVSAWIKVESYPTAGNIAGIVSRTDATNGWMLWINDAGQIIVNGRNGAAGNFSRVVSSQSVPLGRWVHVAGQLDMSAFTVSATTSYIMIDGVDTPATVTRAGTNPTALVQAGNLEVGRSDNSASSLFDGKIAQVAVYSAKVTQANIRATYSQGLTGSETSLLVGYSFNGVLTDLSANGYTLTANGGADATNADSPFALNAYGTPTGTTDYSITQYISTDGLTETVQVPEGNTIPTSGGISALAYSGLKVPFGFPAGKDRWVIEGFVKPAAAETFGSSGAWQQINRNQLTVPVGVWGVRYSVNFGVDAAGAVIHQTTLSTTTNSEVDPRWTDGFTQRDTSANSQHRHSHEGELSLATATTYYLLGNQANGASRSMTSYNGVVKATNGYL